MIEIIGIVTTALAVAGVLTNNRKLRVCFLLWMVSNALTAGIHAYLGIYSLLVRDVIFFILAIEGWFKWGKK
ncbi:MAG: nicotinamide mononucleotide transporter family protein [Thermodesulfovibrionales bacterium]|nr:nicotinamide mononucleotide transporter family protein [Thermodesulfovibrionales bacterium]